MSSLLWHHGNRSTLYSGLKWMVLFDVLCWCMPVYKNANDNHKRGHLDYCQGSCPVSFYLASYHSICFIICFLLILSLSCNDEELVRRVHIGVCVCLLFCLSKHFGVFVWGNIFDFVFSASLPSESECDSEAVSPNQSACLALLTEYFSFKSFQKSPSHHCMVDLSLCPSLFSRSPHPSCLDWLYPFICTVWLCVSHKIIYTRFKSQLKLKSFFSTCHVLPFSS